MLDAMLPSCGHALLRGLPTVPLAHAQRGFASPGVADGSLGRRHLLQHRPSHSATKHAAIVHAAVRLLATAPHTFLAPRSSANASTPGGCQPPTALASE